MYCQNIILFFKINFNWRKIALPCCVGFCHTTAQISHNHAHVTLPPSLVSKESARNAGDPGLILCQEDPLEKEMATHSRILAWRVPWTEEPDSLQSRGCKSQTWLSDWTSITSILSLPLLPWLHPCKSPQSAKLGSLCYIATSHSYLFYTR